MIGKTWYIVPLKLRTFCNQFDCILVRDTVAIVDLRDNFVSIGESKSLRGLVKEKKIRIDVELIKQKQIFVPPPCGLQC